ncbi:WYL domain-containing protein [Streptomyces albidoflavus]|uniref:WYL domain-containing protein n=1 Tax=Streptomyces albidoflavus TaxID=1886 RepID=UPI002F90C045|nr:WYL domain-containing protein [Streptomyces albidoflavus]WSD57000.1 WYL domain-containing protein [Streptomyces albidoflavus]WTE00969.1 WYL domain-containing protein [Streptomyces albidoflavus]
MTSMKHTARQSSTRTLADMIRAMDTQRATTITYLDSNGDETVRTIEIHDIRTTAAGRVIIRAMCRKRGEMRTFHPARIVSYTVHRMAYTLEVPAEESAPAHTARTEAEVIAFELDRDYPDTSSMRLAA